MRGHCIESKPSNPPSLFQYRSADVVIRVISPKRQIWHLFVQLYPVSATKLPQTRAIFSCHVGRNTSLGAKRAPPSRCTTKTRERYGKPNSHHVVATTQRSGSTGYLCITFHINQSKVLKLQHSNRTANSSHLDFNLRIWIRYPMIYINCCVYRI